jgi:four helix bundle protein
MTNEEKQPVGDARKRADFDLEERTARFGEAIILFAKRVPPNPVTVPLISQTVRSGTSIGANYCEADNAESKKDFRHKIGIRRKESREARHWLRMIAAAEPALKEEARRLWQEAKELNLIFSAIRQKSSA